MGLMARLSSFMPKRNAASPKTRLIVGLGNPGKEYEMTRHNVGFLIVDALAGESTWSEKKSFKGQIAEQRANNQKTLLLKPETYMNLSGEAVRAVMQFYKIPLENIVVIHDDADLPFAEVRIQTGRGSAGHNGVKSIMECLGSAEFTRVRVGIGRPSNEKMGLDAFVLEKWTAEESEKLPTLAEEVLLKLKNEKVEH